MFITFINVLQFGMVRFKGQFRPFATSGTDTDQTQIRLANFTVNLSSTKFHQNPFSGFGDETCEGIDRQTDRQTLDVCVRTRNA